MTVRSSAQDWPLPHHDAANTARAGVSLGADVPAPTPGRRMAGGESSPVIVGNVVAYLTELALVVRDHRTGRRMWEAQLAEPEADGYGNTAVAIADDVVVASSHGGVRTFDRATGKQLWDIVDEDGLGRCAASVAWGEVLIGDRTGLLSCLDARSGAERWSARLLPEDGLEPAVELLPAITRSTVFAASDDGFVHAVDRATGRVLWPAVTGGALAGPVCVAGDTVLAASGRCLVAMDAASGERRWRRRLSARLGASLALGEDVVVACTTASVCAFALRDGGWRWDRPLSGRPGPPSIAGEVVLVASSSPDLLHALALRDGRPLWEVPLPGLPTCCPVVVPGRLLMTSGDVVQTFRLDSAGALPTGS